MFLTYVVIMCPFPYPGKPVITYDDTLKDTVTLKAGKTLALPTNITGSPKPKVTWYHGDDEVQQTDKIIIETEGEASRFTAKGSTGKQSGTYKVVAENKVGKDEAEFKVVVLGRSSGKMLWSRTHFPKGLRTHNQSIVKIQL